MQKATLNLRSFCAIWLSGTMNDAKEEKKQGEENKYIKEKEYITELKEDKDEKEETAPAKKIKNC